MRRERSHRTFVLSFKFSEFESRYIQPFPFSRSPASGVSSWALARAARTHMSPQGLKFDLDINAVKPVMKR